MLVKQIEGLKEGQDNEFLFGLIVLEVVVENRDKFDAGLAEFDIKFIIWSVGTDVNQIVGKIE